MSWGDGFSEYYAITGRVMLWLWGITSALLLIIWLAHVIPFSHGSVVSTGVVVERSGCGSKGAFDYTYRYEVDGQSYTAETKWGGYDGNGSCQELVPGASVPITYRVNNPSRSMGSTVHACMKVLVTNLAFLAVICFVLIPFFGYLKKMREGSLN